MHIRKSFIAFVVLSFLGVGSSLCAQDVDNESTAPGQPIRVTPGTIHLDSLNGQAMHISEEPLKADDKLLPVPTREAFDALLSILIHDRNAIRDAGARGELEAARTNVLVDRYNSRIKDILELKDNLAERVPVIFLIGVGIGLELPAIEGTKLLLRKFAAGPQINGGLYFGVKSAGVWSMGIGGTFGLGLHGRFGQGATTVVKHHTKSGAGETEDDISVSAPTTTGTDTGGAVVLDRSDDGLFLGHVTVIAPVGPSVQPTSMGDLNDLYLGGDANISLLKRLFGMAVNFQVGVYVKPNWSKMVTFSGSDGGFVEAIMIIGQIGMGSRKDTLKVKPELTYFMSGAIDFQNANFVDAPLIPILSHLGLFGVPTVGAEHFESRQRHRVIEERMAAYQKLSPGERALLIEEIASKNALEKEANK